MTVSAHHITCCTTYIQTCNVRPVSVTVNYADGAMHRWTMKMRDKNQKQENCTLDVRVTFIFHSIFILRSSSCGRFFIYLQHL